MVSILQGKVAATFFLPFCHYYFCFMVRTAAILSQSCKAEVP